jgi:hypothetical protein
MENYELLLKLAKRAGVTPASFLYTFIEDTLKSAADEPEFQEDWIEVAEETGEREQAKAFFERLIS